MRKVWTSFYWADYLSDTGHLTLMQHGAYLLLMAHYYSTGRPIKASAKQLQRICKASGEHELSEVQEVLDDFFIQRDGFYYHERIEAELRKAEELSAKRRAAGSKGGRGRKASA